MLSFDEQYKKAFEIAVSAHKGQVDKSGVDYIEHPKRVAAQCDGKMKVAAILHDVLEDTSVTEFDLLSAGIDSAVIKLIKCLTRDKEHEGYFEYIQRIKKSPEAVYIKIADIHDNLRPGCPASLQKRYQKALVILEG